MIKKTFSGNGTKNILLLGGIHGNEVTPIQALHQLGRFLDDGSLKHLYKTITIINNINDSGIKKNSRDFVDEKVLDLNRLFVAGKKKAHTTNDIYSVIYGLSRKESELEKIVKTLKNEISAADVILDLHASPNLTRPFVLINQNEYANSYVEYCESNKINYWLRYNDNDTIKKYCIDNGKISLTIEQDILPIDEVTMNTFLLVIIKSLDSFVNSKSTPIYEVARELHYHKAGLIVPYTSLSGDSANIELIGVDDNRFQKIPVNGTLLEFDKTPRYYSPNDVLGYYQPHQYGYLNSREKCYIQP